PMAQADLAAGLLGELDSRRITPDQQSRLARVRSVKPEVHEACLKGWLLVKRGNEPDLQKSIAYFQEAIRVAPTTLRPTSDWRTGTRGSPTVCQRVPGSPLRA